MNDGPSRLADRAQELRLAFDRSFASPARLDTMAKQNLLLIRLGSQVLTLRLSEIGGLFTDKKITRIPSSTASLLGIAGFRGAILPVYDLGLLLGRAKGKASRWLVTAATATAPIALAFDEFDGHLRISTDAILAEGSAERPGHDSVRVDGVVRPILNLPSVLDAIRTQSGQTAPREER